MYLDGGELVYLKRSCAEEDARGRFLLNAFPTDANDLPPESAEAGFERFRFEFARRGVRLGDKCMARLPLPGYPVRAVQIGRSADYEPETWSSVIPMPLDESALAAYRERYAALSAREPQARADFDLRIDGGDLIYLKQPCSEKDAVGRFFLSVFPTDADDLPESRREIGHDSLNFDFDRYGAIFDDKCLIVRNLPEYPIAAIETGQWLPGEGHLWSARVETRK